MRVLFFKINEKGTKSAIYFHNLLISVDSRVIIEDRCSFQVSCSVVRWCHILFALIKRNTHSFPSLVFFLIN